MMGDGFERYWTIELADSAATEEPDQRWICAYGHRLSTRSGEAGEGESTSSPPHTGTGGRRATAERLPVRAAG
jgi:hypothetical protein